MVQRSLLWGFVFMWLAAACADSPGPAPAPQRAEAAPAATSPQQHRYGDDPAQFGWLHLPRRAELGEPVPIVVLIHGGFWSEPWDYTLMSPLAQDLNRAGYATCNIEFRRVGGRGGWPTTFEDVSEAIEHLDELAENRPLDTDQVILVGHSSGGHLALRALDRPGAQIEPLAAIGLAAVTDLEVTGPAVAFLGGTIAELPDVYAAADPLVDGQRSFLIHGDRDTIVPASSLARAETRAVRITIVPNTDHFAPIDPTSAAWTVARDLIGETAPTDQTS